MEMINGCRGAMGSIVSPSGAGLSLQAPLPPSPFNYPNVTCHHSSHTLSPILPRLYKCLSLLKPFFICALPPSSRPQHLSTHHSYIHSINLS